MLEEASVYLVANPNITFLSITFVSASSLKQNSYTKDNSLSCNISTIKALDFDIYIACERFLQC
jgi:hypothetical protein